MKSAQLFWIGTGAASLITLDYNDTNLLQQDDGNCYALNYDKTEMIALIKTFTPLVLLIKNVSYNSSLYKCWKWVKRKEIALPLCFEDYSVEQIFPWKGVLDQLY